MTNLHFFIYTQKPYACQIPGCIKRYTDPSSLRKHVKNHSVKDQLIARRKSTSTAPQSSKSTSTTSTSSVSTASKRRYSESSSIISNQEVSSISTPTPSNDSFMLDDVFNDIIDTKVTNANSCIDQRCTMDFNEMSNCIVTIQNDQSVNSTEGMAAMTTTTNDLKSNNCGNQDGYQFGDNLDFGDDEYISFECVRKILGDQNLEYIDSALQSQFDIDYLNVM